MRVGHAVALRTARESRGLSRQSGSARSTFISHDNVAAVLGGGVMGIAERLKALREQKKIAQGDIERRRGRSTQGA